MGGELPAGLSPRSPPPKSFSYELCSVELQALEVALREVAHAVDHLPGADERLAAHVRAAHRALEGLVPGMREHAGRRVAEVDEP